MEETLRRLLDEVKAGSLTVDDAVARLRDIAYEYRKELPVAVRALLSGIGGSRHSESRLLSYLLFEREFTRALIDLGYRDAMSVKDQLLAFVTGESVPRLFAPDWVQHDLIAVHGDQPTAAAAV